MMVFFPGDQERKGKCMNWSRSVELDRAAYHIQSIWDILELSTEVLWPYSGWFNVGVSIITPPFLSWSHLPVPPKEHEVVMQMLNDLWR